MVSPVIDLSHHNPEPDWNRLAASGVVGVIYKATEGASYVDPTRKDRLADAYRAGLKIATYHFLRSGDMAAQMAHYTSTIDPRPGERLVLDHEDRRVSLADLKRAASILLGQGFEVTIYSGYLIKEQLRDDYDELLAKTSLWVSHYTSKPSPIWPRTTWPNWSLWQWTDREKVTGISEPVDGNRWNGSIPNLIKWFGDLG